MIIFIKKLKPPYWAISNVFFKPISHIEPKFGHDYIKTAMKKHVVASSTKNVEKIKMLGGTAHLQN